MIAHSDALPWAVCWFVSLSTTTAQHGCTSLSNFVQDGIDNTLIREAVQRARARGEVTLSGLSNELGHRRPNVHLLKRKLGIYQYIERYNGTHQVTYAIKRDTATRLWAMVSDEPTNFQAPPEGWANGEDFVLVEPIREAVLKAVAEKRCTFGQLASDLGYFTSDTTPLRRKLGLKNSPYGPQKEIEYDLVVWLTNRLGLDPHETGV